MFYYNSLMKGKLKFSALWIVLYVDLGMCVLVKEFYIDPIIEQYSLKVLSGFSRV